ncbi:MAG: hypothetical protein ACXV7G_09930 [Halobacteriota archaeon]
MNVRLAVLALVAVTIGSLFVAVVTTAADTGDQQRYENSSTKSTPHADAVYAPTATPSPTPTTQTQYAIVQAVNRAPPGPSAEVATVAGAAPTSALINTTSLAMLCALGVGAVIVLAVGLLHMRRRH